MPDETTTTEPCPRQIRWMRVWSFSNFGYSVKMAEDFGSLHMGLDGYGAVSAQQIPP